MPHCDGTSCNSSKTIIRFWCLCSALEAVEASTTNREELNK